MRQSARGEACTLRIAHVCNYDPSTTVLAHLPDESHGMAKKSDDISACFACSACHDVIDGRNKWPNISGVSEVEYRDWYMRRAMVRTWRRWIELGIVVVR